MHHYPCFYDCIKTTKIDKRQESLDKDWRGSRMQPGGGNDDKLLKHFVFTCGQTPPLNLIYSSFLYNFNMNVPKALLS